MKTGPWKLADLAAAPQNGRKVFSCFHCGGGSTMGYKLAGFDVIGGVEIDPEMMAIYRANHQPRLSYLEGVQAFKKRDHLPAELYDLDILDGSPPCSSFSMSGSREKAWGDKKKFREGQAEQVLDDLFFDFIEIAAKLRPRVVVAENVQGLVIGKAKGYVKEIFAGFKAAGYRAQLFLLNSSRMGVPQRRKRTFFIASRLDLDLPPIELDFVEDTITIAEAFVGLSCKGREPASIDKTRALWERCKPGDSFSTVTSGSHFNWIKLSPKDIAPTINGNSHVIFHWETMRNLSDKEFCRIQTFPDDFDFLTTKAGYVCGMSVPPFMMQRVAAEIDRQWFSRLPSPKESPNGEKEAAYFAVAKSRFTLEVTVEDTVE